ncbi:MAG: hypothetical protein H7A36_04350 [Chlamydiales bacterium]|nr:hypothetical protein [Chlamydiales bacterium]
MTSKDYILLSNILKSILDYRERKLDFFTLVNNLDAIYREIEEIDDEWSARFYKNWINLESINAKIIEDSISLADSPLESLADDSLKQMEFATSSLIKADAYSLQSTNDCVIEVEENQTFLLCPLCFEAWENSEPSLAARCPHCGNKFRLQKI